MHTSVSSVLALLAQLKPPSPTLIAIDGHSASGKSSIARALHQVHPASTLVHTDDFYRPLPAHMRNGLDIEGCYAARPVEEGSSVTELREEFNEPSFDPANCLRLYEHAPGELVGFAQLYVAEDTADNDGFLWFKVHPAHRTDRIEPQMFAWAEAQLRTRGRVKLRVTARDKERERQALIERHGFVPVRYFLRMRRALSEPIPVPVFPPGYHLRDGDHDPQAWADLYNDSFADHYNFHSHDAEFVRHWQSDPDYRADLNLVAIAPDGTLAACAWCHIHIERNKRAGRLDGTIGVLGTRRGHRRIGLGRAMLLAGMHRLRDVGMSNADLGVDTSSPTGANTLYESVGFETTYSRVLYSRDVDG